MEGFKRLDIKYISPETSQDLKHVKLAFWKGKMDKKKTKYRSKKPLGPFQLYPVKK